MQIAIARSINKSSIRKSSKLIIALLYLQTLVMIRFWRKPRFSTDKLAIGKTLMRLSKVLIKMT